MYKETQKLRLHKMYVLMACDKKAYTFKASACFVSNILLTRTLNSVINDKWAMLNLFNASRTIVAFFLLSMQLLMLLSMITRLLLGL